MHGSFVGGGDLIVPRIGSQATGLRVGANIKYVGNQQLQYIEVFWFLCETFPSALLGQI